MSYKHTAEKLADYRRQIRELRQKMRDVQAAVEPEPVKDYTFRRADGGSVRLSELFGDKADLFVIHNMGQSCRYCTLWADGFNGAYAHLSNRAAFVVSSPDTPEKQRKFAGKPALCRTRAPRSPRTWATVKTAAGSRASPCSGARTGGSCGCPTRRSRPATISTASGTSSISFPKGPPAGSRSTSTRETAASVQCALEDGRLLHAELMEKE